MAESTSDRLSSTWLSFVEDEKTKSVLDDISANSEIAFASHIGSIQQAKEFLESDSSYTTLLLDISTSKDIEKDIHSIGEVCQEGTRLICVGDENSVAYYKALQSLGVDDYLVKPISQDSVINSIRELFTSGDEALPKDMNPFVAILGSRGGLGCSSLALNLSWVLSQEMLFNTCLVDFDLHYGNSLVQVNTDANQGLTQALKNAERLDEVFLRRLTVDVHKNISILASEIDLDQAFDYTREDILNLTNLLRTNFRVCVADIPHGSIFLGNSPLAIATHVVIVSELSVTSLRDTARTLQFIKGNMPFAKVHIVAIRNPLAKAAEVTRVQFEEGVGEEVRHFIPFDKATMLTHHNLGKCIVQAKPNHKIVSPIRDLAKALFPTQKISDAPWWQPLLFWK